VRKIRIRREHFCHRIIQWLTGDTMGVPAKEIPMLTRLIFAALLLAPGAALAQAQKPNDAQIAHIAYTAGVLDIAAAKQALAKSSNADVKSFASEMVRDHQAVNDKALALVKKLNVTPEDNATSQALSKAAAAKLAELDKLSGAAFDRAYVENEVAYHKTVNGALKDTLIPDSQNAKLKSLLQTGLSLFTAHQKHAEHLSMSLAK
jgi:putative membrane protein